MSIINGAMIGLAMISPWLLLAFLAANAAGLLAIILGIGAGGTGGRIAALLGFAWIFLEVLVGLYLMTQTILLEVSIRSERCKTIYIAKRQQPVYVALLECNLAVQPLTFLTSL